MQIPSAAAPHPFYPLHHCEYSSAEASAKKTKKASVSILRKPSLEIFSADSLAKRCPKRGLALLGLITQALLVAVQLHALAALVLCDLSFAFLFD